MKELDANQDGFLTIEEFTMVLERRDLVQVMEKLGLDKKRLPPIAEGYAGINLWSTQHD